MTTSGELRKPRMLTPPKHSLDRLPTLKASGVHDLIDSITAQTAECGERWDARRAALNQDEMFIAILWRTCPLTADSFSNHQCLERIWAK